MLGWSHRRRHLQHGSSHRAGSVDCFHRRKNHDEFPACRIESRGNPVQPRAAELHRPTERPAGHFVARNEYPVNRSKLRLFYGQRLRLRQDEFDPAVELKGEDLLVPPPGSRHFGVLRCWQYRQKPQENGVRIRRNSERMIKPECQMARLRACWNS